MVYLKKLMPLIHHLINSFFVKMNYPHLYPSSIVTAKLLKNILYYF